MTAVSSEGKVVTGSLLDKSLFAKTCRVCDPFPFDVSTKTGTDLL